MLLKEITNLSKDPVRVSAINWLLEQWINGEYPLVFDNKDFKLIENVYFLYFFYSLIFKGITQKSETNKILRYLNKSYKNLETNLFISNTFLSLLSELDIDNFDLKDNIWVPTLLSKFNGEVIVNEKFIWNELNVVLYLFLEMNTLWLDLIKLKIEEIDKMMVLKDEILIDLINKLNQFIYVFSLLNKKGVIDNLLMFNTSYLELRIVDVDPSEENTLITKLNSWLNNLFQIHPLIFEKLKIKGLSISEKNYKTLISKNFSSNYLLKILPSNIQNPPFFKPYIDKIVSNVDFILSNYYKQDDEKITIIKEQNNEKIFKISWFRFDHQEEYSKIHKSFWLLKYLNLQEYIYDYIIVNKLELSSLKNIDLIITLKEWETTGIFNDRKKDLVLYELFINWDKIYETTSD